MMGLHGQDLDLLILVEVAHNRLCEEVWEREDILFVWGDLLIVGLRCNGVDHG